MALKVVGEAFTKLSMKHSLFLRCILLCMNMFENPPRYILSSIFVAVSNTFFNHSILLQRRGKEVNQMRKMNISSCNSTPPKKREFFTNDVVRVFELFAVIFVLISVLIFILIFAVTLPSVFLQSSRVVILPLSKERCQIAPMKAKV